MKLSWYGLGFIMLGAATWAADLPPSSAVPDLAPIRAQIYSGQFAEASVALLELSKTVQHADLYNLLGYSLRNLGRYDEAARWYKQALYYDPGHRPALEYQAELFIAMGDIAAAKKNLRYLELLCTTDVCPERDLLRSALER